MNNTTSTALETYISTLNMVQSARAGFNQTPLSVRRKALSGPTQRLATPEQVEQHAVRNFGAATHDAGMLLLASIKEEILANEPQWKKDLRERELELERITAEKDACAEVAAMSAD